MPREGIERALYWDEELLTEDKDEEEFSSVTNSSQREMERLEAGVETFCLDRGMEGYGIS
ncbi:hypothetical protein chiPu_0029568, partial [Chiloscyllium punctatum]|nr:hypothetical protein [Chiloscyllium punctatum]